MKLMWAILCSLALVAAPMPQAQSAPIRVIPSCPACCHPGGNMSCCAPLPDSNPQPAPANPTRTGTQEDFSLLLAASLTSNLVIVETHPHSFPVLSPLKADDLPLYARHCARLI
jgi:hypothetical protein